MPTIEDLIIQEVQEYPSIYSSQVKPMVNNKKHFAAIAKKINNKHINGIF